MYYKEFGFEIVLVKTTTKKYLPVASLSTVWNVAVHAFSDIVRVEILNSSYGFKETPCILH